MNSLQNQINSIYVAAYNYQGNDALTVYRNAINMLKKINKELDKCDNWAETYRMWISCYRAVEQWKESAEWDGGQDYD